MVRLLPTSVDYRFAALAKRASLLLRRAAFLRWIMPRWAVLSRLEYAVDSASVADSVPADSIRVALALAITVLDLDRIARFLTRFVSETLADFSLGKALPPS